MGRPLKKEEEKIIDSQMEFSEFLGIRRRWEFQPSSTLFLVWSQSREATLESVRESDLEFRPLHRLGKQFHR